MSSIDPHNGLKNLKTTGAYDFLVIGAGAGGMAAALFAAIAGKKVLLVERTPYVGGTSALSGGTTWVPLTRYMKDTPCDDSFDKVMNFLDHAVGNHSDRKLRDMFIRQGADAIHTLVDHTQVAFRACAYHPDYMADLPDATVNGRALEPLPYVAKDLGDALSLLRHPIPEFTVLGGMMVNREDIGHLLNRFKTPKSFFYTGRLVARYALDKMLYGRTRRSVMGHALIARMLQSLKDLQVDLLVNTEVLSLTQNDQGNVVGATLQQGDETLAVTAQLGVVMASGGFARNPEKRARLLPSSLPKESPSAEGHSSNVHFLAEQAGAHYGEGQDQPAFWAPVSTRQRQDHSTAVFPHFVFDRSKPGTFCVDLNGKRFVNETLSYHEFGKAMLAGGPSTSRAWIITDAKGLEKYGLGQVRLGGDNPAPYLKDGYLKMGQSIAELAKAIEVDANNLQESVDSINDAARLGVDHLFQRGSNNYQKANGDPAQQPNPTLGSVTQAPFYAVQLQPADIGAAQGLAGNEYAQLLDTNGQAIAGLYACGNDLHSIMGGTYPGPGITIGPAIVFAYIAIQHACSQTSTNTHAVNDQANAVNHLAS